MPRHKSAVKQLRSSKRKEKHNTQLKSRIKTLVRNVEESLATKEKEKINKVLISAVSEIQRAATRGVIHKNTASRKISRMTKKAQKASAV